VRRLRTLGYYAAHALLSVLVLASLPPLRAAPLAVPITYERDGLFLTVLTKSIHEDGLWHASHFGAPFGTDLVDWPLGMWLPFAQMAGLRALLDEPGAAINVYWMSTIVLAGLCAAFAFRRLRLAPWLAFVLGILYAFQPYAFYRNVEHVNLAFPFVPLLALLCLRVAGTRPEDESRGERRLTLLACVAQGFSYVYYSVFACALLVAAAPIGWLRARRPALLLRAGLAVALLAGCTLVTLAPSLAYWRAHGYNPDLDYKPPAETDTYGLKLRHLLVPIAEHPLPPWRALAAKVEAVDFPGDNENVLSKLATLGSLGLLTLLGLLVARAANAVRPLEEPLPGAAALTLVTLLLANVGGLASLFSVFVTPDVRGWDRTVVFLSFFCLLATAWLLSQAARQLPRLHTPVVAVVVLALLLAAGLLDEIPLQRLATLREGTATAFAEERDLVRAIEARLPAGAMVFQLPNMTVPVDRATFSPMLYYDPGRAYVHSRGLRWSWGAMIGRNHDWGRAVDALPLPEKVRTLALAGFSGIWIDRWGYSGEPRPPYDVLERELTSLAGQQLLVSRGGRYSFVNLEPYRRQLEAALDRDRIEHLRRQALSDMPAWRWREGCSEERRTELGWSRSCSPSATLSVWNWRPGAVRFTLRARLRAATAPLVLTVSGPAFEDRVELAAQPSSYERVFEVDGTDTGPVRLEQPRPGELRLQVAPAGACAAACYELIDMSIETRRLIRGVPVNADGGIAVRTKY
jgi:hypothetical protein